jgi:hypothetical protein
MNLQLKKFASIVFANFCESGELFEVLGPKGATVDLNLLSFLIVINDELVESKDQLVACEAAPF